MNKFYKKPLRFLNKINDNDDGIKVSELISLINNDVGKKLLHLMDVTSIKDEFINIPNAKALVDIQKTMNKRYRKIDIDSSMKDISLYSPDGEFSINFNDLRGNEYFSSLGLSSIHTIPIYSAQNDFFSGLYSMDKYATQLIARGHKDIIQMNWERLQQEIPLKKKFRILHDLEDQEFYLRAIVSTDKYNNYNNDIAIVVALLTLHSEMKAGQIRFRLASCEYNQSTIRMFFESSDRIPLEGIGYVKNFIEVANNELGQGSLSFSGSCNICFSDGRDGEGRVFIQSKDVKSKILSIWHNRTPRTALRELASIANSRDIHAELFKDIATIKKIRKPEQIKLLIEHKIENAKREDIVARKTQIKEILKQSASNIMELLTIFNRLEIFAREDVEMAEYLRLAIYEALIKRK